MIDPPPQKGAHNMSFHLYKILENFNSSIVAAWGWEGRETVGGAEAGDGGREGGKRIGEGVQQKKEERVSRGHGGRAGG